MPLLITMVALIIVGKIVVHAGVVRLFGESLRTSVLTGIGLAQIGEFSFVLVQAARQEGHVGPDVYQATLAASLISIVLNAALVPPEGASHLLGGGLDAEDDHRITTPRPTGRRRHAALGSAPPMPDRRCAG